MEKRNKIVSEIQKIIKERVELQEIKIPGTITFQVIAVDGKEPPVREDECLLIRYSSTHLEYSHECGDDSQRFHMVIHFFYCKEQKDLFGKKKYKVLKLKKETVTEAMWKNDTVKISLMDLIR